MAWEYRGTAGPYFYRSVRQGKRVRKVYFGHGVVGQQAAREDADRRAARADEQQAILAEKALLQPIQAMTGNLEDTTNLLLEASLLAANYHRSNFGPWRKKRGN